MRFLKGYKVKKKVVDSKDWLSDDYDVLAERAYMKSQMDARRKLESLQYETPQKKIDRQVAELSDMINSMRNK